jgi:erythromycin esterase-like protein
LEITKRLIAEAGYTAVAVEADWPDAYRVNRYVRGLGDDTSADEALSGFRRFPVWMWRNTDVVELVEWLREHNDALPDGATKAGFYGLRGSRTSSTPSSMWTRRARSSRSSGPAIGRSASCRRPTRGASSG